MFKSVFIFLMSAVSLYLVISNTFPILLVQGPSMEPTLKHGEFLLATSIFSRKNMITGEIYVHRINKNGKPRYVIKRLILISGGKCYFVGDNRDNSIDSRKYGFIDKKDVLYKVLYKKGQILNEIN